MEWIRFKRKLRETKSPIASNKIDRMKLLLQPNKKLLTLQKELLQKRLPLLKLRKLLD